MGRNGRTLGVARELILAKVPDAKIAVHAGDSTDENDVKGAVAATIAHGGGIDIVVATVGGGGGFVPVIERNLAGFMDDLKLNIGASFLAVRYAAPEMRDGGAFVFISSTAAEMAFTGLSSYCAGKAGLDQFMRVAANELGGRGIRLNSIRPGLTHTDGMEALFRTPGFVDAFKPLVPLGRTGIPNDIAEAVCFLAGPHASWITGQSFAVDGGNELRGAPAG
jgi:NAD(P)-dependent dehydrogenase (short-subunit alcohol dehydrogenase family)